MAISFKAQFIHWYIYFWQFLANRASVNQIRDNVQKTFKSENSPVVLPDAITSNTGVVVTKEVFESSQKWEVFHVKPNGRQTRKKAVVYWHGGAFIRGTSPKHWDAIARMATESGCRVVVPIYTLAPLSTAREWEEVALDLIINLTNDERYEGYQFVHMGDSAGGWMTMRIYQAMMEVSLGSESAKKGPIEEALKRMDTGIMISPLINPEINDELIEASQTDCWLSVNLFNFVNRLWTNGPTDFPSLLASLPQEAQDRYSNFPKKPLDSPEICLDKNIAIFEKYAKAYPDHGPFKFTTFIGTADMCHKPVLKLQLDLDRMDRKVVVSDTTIEEGLYHVYPLIPAPEADRAWRRIREVLES